MYIPSNFTLEEALGIVDIPDRLRELIEGIMEENETLGVVMYIPSNFTLEEALGIVDIPDRLRNLIEGIMEENETLLAENETLSDTVTELNAGNAELRERIEELTDDLATANAHIYDLCVIAYGLNWMANRPHMAHISQPSVTDGSV